MVRRDRLGPLREEGQEVHAGRQSHLPCHASVGVSRCLRSQQRHHLSIGDADAPVTRAGKTHDLRWAILSVLEETARHAGHLDLVRELLDGEKGYF